jgi:hypothetical protein
MTPIRKPPPAQTVAAEQINKPDEEALSQQTPRHQALTPSLTMIQGLP